MVTRRRFVQGVGGGLLLSASGLPLRASVAQRTELVGPQFDLTVDTLPVNYIGVARTAEKGEAIYWSRSRNRLWHKGEESGHVQKVKEIRLDCDEDVIVLQVEQQGGIACHTGRRRCFYRRLEGQGASARWIETDPVLADPGSFRHG